MIRMGVMDTESKADRLYAEKLKEAPSNEAIKLAISRILSYYDTIYRHVPTRGKPVLTALFQMAHFIDFSQRGDLDSDMEVVRRQDSGIILTDKHAVSSLKCELESLTLPDDVQVAGRNSAGVNLRKDLTTLANALRGVAKG